MALLDPLMAHMSAAAALRRGLRQLERGDMKGAFVLLSRAARAGLPEGEFRVGRCYLEGTGVPPSRTDGVRWVERAASKGYVEAQALLATLCLHGMGPGFGDGARGRWRQCRFVRRTNDRRARLCGRSQMGPSCGRGRVGRGSGGSRLHPYVRGRRTCATLKKATAGMKSPRLAAARKGNWVMPLFSRAIPATPNPRPSSFNT